MSKLPVEFGRLGIPVVLAGYFALIVISNGVPALRHDWNWPDYYWPFVHAISGWSTVGIGGINPFVNNYLLVVLLAPIGAVFGPLLTLLIFLFCSALFVVLAAKRLATAMGAHALGANAAAAFALFNPWVYTEVIAGHLPMIVAYAAMMALASEATRAKPQPLVCALFLAFTLPQIQFFAVALLVTLVLALRHKMWLPAATWVALSIPTAAGVIFGAREFAATPLTLTWERTQSVAPLPALLLTGYFAKYALGFDKLGKAALALILVTALGGLVVSWPSRRAIAAAGVALLALVVAMGLNGPARDVLAYAFVHLPAFGLYRELYDVVGFAAIAYVALIAIAAAYRPMFTAAACLAVLVLLVAWAHFSPAKQWANRGTLPSLVTIAQPNTRLALLPAFQPLRYQDRFGGLDPDSYVRPDGVTPLNEEVPTWPESSALAGYTITEDWRPLAALGVSEIANRPWFTQASRELNDQLAIAPSAQLPQWQRVPFRSMIPAVPQLSLIPVPPVVTVPSKPGAGAVFFGDVAGLRGGGIPPAWASYEAPQRIIPRNQFVRASDGWVDARLAFVAQPQLGQPFGGALTTNPTAVLDITGESEALVFVRGELLTQDRVLTHTTETYRWIPLPPSTTRLHCIGLCLVALEGHPPEVTDNSSSSAPYIGLEPVTFAPWLVRADVPPGPAGALRYNVRYDERWLALGSPQLIAHVRIDGCVNGWLLPQRDTKTNIWLIEWVALLQTAAQALGLAWLIGLVWQFRHAAVLPA